MTRDDSQWRFLAQHRVQTVDPHHSEPLISSLICTSIIFRDRGIVMWQSLLFSQLINNNLSSRCGIAPVQMLVKYCGDSKQCCNAVLRWKSSLRIDPCNITFFDVKRQCRPFMESGRRIGNSAPDKYCKHCPENSLFSDWNACSTNVVESLWEEKGKIIFCPPDC